MAPPPNFTTNAHAQTLCPVITGYGPAAAAHAPPVCADMVERMGGVAQEGHPVTAQLVAEIGQYLAEISRQDRIGHIGVASSNQDQPAHTNPVAQAPIACGTSSKASSPAHMLALPPPQPSGMLIPPLGSFQSVTGVWQWWIGEAMYSRWEGRSPRDFQDEAVRDTS